MLYVYRRAASNSARDLADSFSVNSRKIGDLASAHYGQGVRAGDFVICWGESLTQAPTGVKVLNGAPQTSKFEAARKLLAAHVPTVEVSLTQPTQVAANAVFHLQPDQLHLNRATALRVIRDLQGFLATPERAPDTWLPRRNNHVGGNDLLHPGVGEYYSKKEALTQEFRIHVFRGKSIRAGVKTPREGATPHDWIRSYDGGWKIDYTEFTSTKAQRKVAIDAVAALGLDFGAVDIGQKEDGSFIVLEVNRAPGTEGGTVTAYTRAIEAWIQNPETPADLG